MATLKQGSKGEEVKVLQRLMGITPIDGIFGGGTAAKVKAWQAAHRLTADSVVGPATWAALEQSIIGVGLTKSGITTHITPSAGRPLKYIVIHYTAGTSSRRGQAMATRSVFLSRSASADFVVDDESIVQVNPDIHNYYCWAVGDAKNKYSGGGRLHGIATNKNTISIEVCSTLRSGTTAAIPNHEGWSFTDRVLSLTRNLVRYLMQAYGIPKQNVIRHYDVTGKPCPGIPGWNDAQLYDTTGKAMNGKKSNSAKWELFYASI